MTVPAVMIRSDMWAVHHVVVNAGLIAGRRSRAAGIVVGHVADRVVGDPSRGHPVAGFGWCADRLERFTYRDSRIAGVLHTGTLVAATLLIGGTTVLAVGAATWVSLGGRSLAGAGERLADLLDDDRVGDARELLPALCGRDPSVLDADGLARAGLESVAENTSDAHVAPLFWASVGGVRGVLAYRAVNTLDAMIGNRSPRYVRFGWAAARLDDVANYLPARLTGALVVLCAPAVGGSPLAVIRAWRRDAARHPSPNAGVVEAAFAGALGIRLGGPTQYRHELEIRPTLGDGRLPGVDDLRRAVRLSRMVQTFAAVLAAGIPLGLSVVGRIGRRACLRR